MDKQQVNIRLPKIIVKAVKEQADLVGLSYNDVYTVALFEYLSGKGLIRAKREE